MTFSLTRKPARLADDSVMPELGRLSSGFYVVEMAGKHMTFNYDQLIYLKGLIHDEQGTGTADLMAMGLAR